MYTCTYIPVYVCMHTHMHYSLMFKGILSTIKYGNGKPQLIVQFFLVLTTAMILLTFFITSSCVVAPVLVNHSWWNAPVTSDYHMITCTR